MKINSKSVFVAIVVILLLGLWLLDICGGLRIDHVVDGSSVFLNNGSEIRLIGVSNTEQAKKELEGLVGKKVTLQPDMSANFDAHLLSKGDVVDAYLLLNDNNYECINATILKKGFAELVEGGRLVDSLDNFREYAQLGRKNGNVNPIPIVQVIDYSTDDIQLPLYTPQPERRHNTWHNEGTQNIDMLNEACDYNLPYTKMFANQLAGRAQGEFSIEQVCEIFDYCYNKWRYVNDPKGQDYIARASESISSSLTGDCDDFAVLIASCILACGGDACIVYANGSHGCHAYPEVDIESFKRNKEVSYIQDVISSRFSRYSPSTLAIRNEGSHTWLNLDWQAAYPGGRYFEAEEKVFYSIVDGNWKCSQ